MDNFMTKNLMNNEKRLREIFLFRKIFLHRLYFSVSWAALCVVFVSRAQTTKLQFYRFIEIGNSLKNQIISWESLVTSAS